MAKKYRYFKTGKACGGGFPAGETVTAYVVRNTKTGFYYDFEGNATYDINKMHTVSTRKAAVSHSQKIFTAKMDFPKTIEHPSETTLGSYKVFRIDFTPQVTFTY